MGIFDALNTSVGGLQAQSFALAEHFRQHRECLDHRLQGHRYQLRGSHSGRDRRRTGRSPAASPPSRRRRSPPRAPSRHRPSPPTWRSTATASSRCRRPPAPSTSAGLQRRHRLHPPRRFPGQRQRQSRQRRRILPDGRRGRSEDRQPARQRAAGSAVSEQFRSGAGDQRDSIRRQPSDHAGDRRPAPPRRRHAHGRRRPEPRRFHASPIRWWSARRRRPSATPRHRRRRQ